MDDKPTHHLAKLTDKDVIRLRQFTHLHLKIQAKEHAQLFGVSVTTIRDAVAGYTYKHLNKVHPPFTVQLTTHGRSANSKKFNDQSVIELRRQVRRDGRRNTVYHAQRFGVSPSLISKVVRGGMFSHVNSIEPPVLETLKYGKPFKKKTNR